MRDRLCACGGTSAALLLSWNGIGTEASLVLLDCLQFPMPVHLQALLHVVRVLHVLLRDRGRYIRKP